jgi:hypothetical protein
MFRAIALLFKQIRIVIAPFRPGMAIGIPGRIFGTAVRDLPGFRL